MRGKFIVLYGINNLGKTTQTEKLVERLNQEGIKTEYLKYPIYKQIGKNKVIGNLINNYLRESNTFEITPREAQILYALDRSAYEKELEKKIETGINIVAEDYTGTGLAWGEVTGIDPFFLEYINHHLLREDLAILLDGERFRNAEEQGHRHESNEELMKKARNIHLKLAKKYNWQIVNANDTIEEVHNNIWEKVKSIF